MHNRKRPNRQEQRRFLEIQDRGCVPCRIEAELQDRKWIPEPCDIHHVQQANRTGDHLHTYGSCPWHHRGIRKNDLDYLEMQRIFGPSMARNPRRYHERYGDEGYLLAYQNALLLKSPPNAQEI